MGRFKNELEDRKRPRKRQVLKKGPEPKPKPKKEELTDEERLVKAKADKIELEIAIKKKELVPASVIQKEWETMAVRMKTRLMQIPGSLAQELSQEDSPAVIEDLIKKRVSEALAELSQG
mgnify:CR=1 FL=1